MRTVVQTIQVGALLTEQGIHFIVNRPQTLKGAVSACNDRLIGYDAATVFRCIQPSYGITHAWQ